MCFKVAGEVQVGLFGITWQCVSKSNEKCSTHITVFFLTCLCKCWFLYSWLHLTLNIPSLARQRRLPSWGPRRTPWFFCNFSTVWCGRLLKLFFGGLWNYNSVIQALLVSDILCLFQQKLANNIARGFLRGPPLVY